MEKLIITDHGDPSVGVFAQTWEVEVPFDLQEMDSEEIEFFRYEIKKLYGEFCEGNITAVFESELKQEFEEEQQID